MNSAQTLLPYRIADRFSVGQNVAATWTFDKPSPAGDEPEFKRQIEAWFNEVTQVGFRAQDIEPFNFNRQAGHYSQVRPLVANPTHLARRRLPGAEQRSRSIAGRARERQRPSLARPVVSATPARQQRSSAREKSKPSRDNRCPCRFELKTPSLDACRARQTLGPIDQSAGERRCSRFPVSLHSLSLSLYLSLFPREIIAPRGVAREVRRSAAGRCLIAAPFFLAAETRLFDSRRPDGGAAGFFMSPKCTRRAGDPRIINGPESASR